MRLVDCFTPLLARVEAFARQPSGAPEALAATLDAAIDDARRRAAAAGASPAEVEAALFACCAWADEALQLSAWDAAAQWQRHLLQRRHFGVVDAGVAFFDRLARIERADHPALELYALVLAMGFGGFHASRGDTETLARIRRDVLARALTARAPEVGPEDPADPAPAPAGSATRARWRAWWSARRLPSGSTMVALALPPALVLLVYAIAVVVLRDAAMPLLTGGVR